MSEGERLAVFDQWEQSRGQDSLGPHGTRIMNQNTRGEQRLLEVLLLFSLRLSPFAPIMSPFTFIIGCLRVPCKWTEGEICCLINMVRRSWKDAGGKKTVQQKNLA